MKVNVTSRIVWIWDCPICGRENTEGAYDVDSLDLVCANCKEEFELGEVFNDA